MQYVKHFYYLIKSKDLPVIKLIFSTNYSKSTKTMTFAMAPYVLILYGTRHRRALAGEFDFPVINQQAAQMDGIAKEILEGRKLPEHISGIEGRKDMKVLEAIYKAAESGRKVILT